MEVLLDTLVDTVDEGGVRLHDGTEISTSTMVLAAGVRPANLLDGSGRRIEVDDHFRIRGADGGYAIGDVAAWHPPRHDLADAVTARAAGRTVRGPV